MLLRHLFIPRHAFVLSLCKRTFRDRSEIVAGVFTTARWCLYIRFRFSTANPLDMYQCPRGTRARTSEVEDVGEARSGRERDTCIVAGPLLYLSQKRGRPGHAGTAYQTDPDVEGPGQRRPASPMILRSSPTQIE